MATKGCANVANSSGAWGSHESNPRRVPALILGAALACVATLAKRSKDNFVDDIPY